MTTALLHRASFPSDVAVSSLLFQFSHLSTVNGYFYTQKH